MKNRVAILLSTYNGEKFIASQIESILNQIDCEIDIYVRDDGSTDKTTQLLREYQKLHPNIYLTEGNNVGYKQSFFSLIFSVSGYDYYAFSDQDDIWLETKVSAAIEFLSQTNEEALYACKKIYVDENLQPLQLEDKSLPLNLDYGFFRGGICGCTMVWNNTLHSILQEFKPRQNFKSHDDYLRCLAIAIGAKTYLDETPHILYRRHSTNQSLLPNERLKRLFTKGLSAFGSRKDLKLICKDISEGYSNLVTPDAAEMLQDILANDSLHSRLSLIKSSHIKTVPSYEEALLKLLILLKGIN